MIRSQRILLFFIAPVLIALTGLAVATVVSGCSPGRQVERRYFEQQLAIVSPHDEDGGRFDGATISPGFGILYLNGYTNQDGTNADCGGFFAEVPEHVLELQYSINLKIVAHSDVGVVFAVKGPDGSWTCWDEDVQNNENVSLTQHFDSGVYELWVGGRAANSATSYRIVLSE